MKNVEELQKSVQDNVIHVSYKVVFFLALAEAIIGFLLYLCGVPILDSWILYFLKYLALPTILNFLMVFIVDRLNKSSCQERVKDCAFALLYCTIGFILATVHSYFLAIQSVFVAPIIMVCLLDDVAMLKLTTKFSFFILWVSIFLSPLFDNTWSLAARCGNGIVVCIFIGVVYFICKNILVYSSSKDSLLNASYNYQRKLKKLSKTDTMTGLYNHTAFYELLDKLVQDPEREDLVIAVMDVDDFKKVNDQYGHANGDTVLKHIASILREKTKSPFRYGGEEFVVVFTNTSKDAALGIMEDVRRAVNACVFDFMSGRISISVGLYVVGKDDNDSRVIFSMADSALYEAKTAGKNKSVVY